MKNTIRLATLTLMACTIGISQKTIAQSLTSDDIKAQLVKEWERAKNYTIDYLNTMPAGKYGFKPVDTIRSFAQQMLHLAQANIFLMSMSTDTKPTGWAQSDLEHSPTAQSKDSVMYYVTSSYDYCINGVKNLDPSKWGEKKKIFNTFDETRFGMLLKTFEHQTHHRGQTTIYIRLQGIRPPQERLFEK
jgi:uncharacterized damage-inducible protein DinB